MAIKIAQEPHADEVLNSSPFALLVGMMLDQQYPMEHAFRGPAKVLDRFGNFDPAKIAEAEPEAFADLCSTPPAIHRYGRSMAGRLQELAGTWSRSTTVTHPASGPSHVPARRSSSAYARCPASVSRRPRSSPRCWPSSST